MFTFCNVRLRVSPKVLHSKLNLGSGRFIEYLLQRNDVSEIWNEYMYHEFVEKLADGTLDQQSFQEYLVQDYLYLVRLPLRSETLTLIKHLKVHFARSNALAAYKSKSISDISKVSERERLSLVECALKETVSRNSIAYRERNGVASRVLSRFRPR